MIYDAQEELKNEMSVIMNSILVLSEEADYTNDNHDDTAALKRSIELLKVRFISKLDELLEIRGGERAFIRHMKNAAEHIDFDFDAGIED